jgi:hypothetical protein
MGGKRKDLEKGREYRRKWEKNPKRMEYSRTWQRNNHKEKKKLLVALAGGKCVQCGYSKCFRALEFHHINPEDKEIKSFIHVPIEVAKAEIKKCILVCSNCHAEIHEELESN